MARSWQRADGPELRLHLPLLGAGSFVSKSQGFSNPYLTTKTHYIRKKRDGSLICDTDALDDLRTITCGRRMAVWSRVLSSIRRELGFPSEDGEAFQDLVDIGDKPLDEAYWEPIAFRDIQMDL